MTRTHAHSLIGLTLLHALLCAVLALAGNTSANDKNGQNSPEDVVWKYINSEFERAAGDPTYWKKRWYISAPTRAEIRIGKPYSEYRLNPDDLALFVSSGDLVGSAFLADVSYPVFEKNALIATIQVVETAGRWECVSRHLVGPVDSLAASHGEKGETVATIGSKALGAFMLITKAGSSETRVYSITSNSPIKEHADAQGTVSYSDACQLLRPVADKWLEGYKANGKEKEQR